MNHPRQTPQGLPPQITETTHWQVVIPREKFDKIKTNEEFCSLLTLARIVNSLDFVNLPSTYIQHLRSPTDVRTKRNSFLFTCALLAEATNVIQHMHRAFGAHPQFNKLVAAISSTEVRQVLKHIQKIRNKLVFHFDITEIQQQMATFEPKDVVFASCLGLQIANRYNTLADDIALRVLFGPELPENEQKMSAFANTIGFIVFRDFLPTAEEFIVSVLIEKKWALVR